VLIQEPDYYGKEGGPKTLELELAESESQLGVIHFPETPKTSKLKNKTEGCIYCWGNPRSNLCECKTPETKKEEPKKETPAVIIPKNWDKVEKGYIRPDEILLSTKRDVCDKDKNKTWFYAKRGEDFVKILAENVVAASEILDRMFKRKVY